MQENKLAELVHRRLITATGTGASVAALKIMDAIQTERLENQLLGIAAVFICMLDRYELDHVDPLNIAYNMVYSGGAGNMAKNFKAIKNFMKKEWEI